MPPKRTHAEIEPGPPLVIKAFQGPEMFTTFTLDSASKIETFLQSSAATALTDAQRETVHAALATYLP